MSARLVRSILAALDAAPRSCPRFAQTLVYPIINRVCCDPRRPQAHQLALGSCENERPPESVNAVAVLYFPDAGIASRSTTSSCPTDRDRSPSSAVSTPSSFPLRP